MRGGVGRLRPRLVRRQLASAAARTSHTVPGLLQSTDHLFNLRLRKFLDTPTFSMLFRSTRRAQHSARAARDALPAEHAGSDSAQSRARLPNLSIRQNHDNDCARMSSCRNSKHFHLNIPPPFRRTRASLSALTHTPPRLRHCSITYAVKIASVFFVVDLTLVECIAEI